MSIEKLKQELLDFKIKIDEQEKIINKVLKLIKTEPTLLNSIEKDDTGKKYILRLKSAQSYNHFFPKGLIKKGWATYSNDSVDAISLDKIKIFLKDNLDVSYIDFEQHWNFKLACQTNPTNIFGNKILLDSTEEAIAQIFSHTQMDHVIEKPILDIIKSNIVVNDNLESIYKWFALQNTRSLITLKGFVNLYANYLYIGISEENYLDFKKYYNKEIFNFFEKEYLNNKNMKYSCILGDLQTTPYFLLGELNVLPTSVFVPVMREAMAQKIHNYSSELINLFSKNLAEVSLISSDKILFKYNTKKYRKKMIKEGLDAITELWNMTQVLYSIDNLIYKKDPTNQIIDFFWKNRISLLKLLESKNRLELKNINTLISKYEKR